MRAAAAVPVAVPVADVVAQLEDTVEVGAPVGLAVELDVPLTVAMVLPVVVAVLAGRLGPASAKLAASGLHRQPRDKDSLLLPWSPSEEATKSTGYSYTTLDLQQRRCFRSTTRPTSGRKKTPMRLLQLKNCCTATRVHTRGLSDWLCVDAGHPQPTALQISTLRLQCGMTPR